MWIVLLIALYVGQSQTALIDLPPTITEQPIAGTFYFNRNTFQLPCEGTGPPEPSYRWTKNGEPFNVHTNSNNITQSSGNGTLTFSSPNENDQGSYQCFIENNLGTASSNIVYLQSIHLSEYPDQTVANVTVNEGDTLKLPCKLPAGTSKHFIVGWLVEFYEGGYTLPEKTSRTSTDPNANLYFTNVTLFDRNLLFESDNSRDPLELFCYICIALPRDGGDLIRGNRVSLNVIRNDTVVTENRREPTPLYRTPQNEVGLRGSDVKLRCIYGGTPTPQVNWTSLGGSPIVLNDRVVLDDYGRLLTIKNATFEDETIYTCLASNGVGRNISYSIWLNIHTAPYFLVEPKSEIVPSDDRVEFHCQVHGVPSPKVEWTRNGVPLAANEKLFIKEYSLTIENVQSDDTGNFGCNASNIYGYVYKDFYLRVTSQPPQIIEKPEDIEIFEGESANFYCSVFGVPAPEIQWFFKNELLAISNRYETDPEGYLTVNNVTADDAGEYRCHSINKYGEADESTVLTVRKRTQIIGEPAKYLVSDGEDITIQCDVTADPAFDVFVKWIKDENDDISDSRIVVHPNKSLTIQNTSREDTGVYRCSASTVKDQITAARAIVVFEDRPNPPSIVVDKCDTKKATVSIRNGGDNRSPISHYIIQYNTSLAPEKWHTIENVLKSDREVASLELDMNPLISYSWRAIAVNGVGESLPGASSQHCMAAPDVPYKNPDNVEITAIDSGSLVISWTPMSQSEHNGAEFRYRVYTAVDMPHAVWESAVINDWAQCRYIITNLPPYTRYRVQVQAENEIGLANATAKVFYGYSGEEAPREAPTDFKMLQIIDQRSILVSWNSVSSKNLRGHTTGYKIQVWNDVDQLEKSTEILIGIEFTKALVDGLRPGALNHVRIFAFNGRFNGPVSATLDVMTPDYY